MSISKRMSPSLLVTVLPQRFAKAEAARLELQLSMKKTFVRYISHELRTPLSIALTGIALVEEELRNGASVHDLVAMLHDIKQPCLTGVSILNELLDFEKLDSGLTVLECGKQDANEVLMTVIKEFRLVARQKQIELDIQNMIEPRSVTVNVDEPKISQVLRNLLSNAMKFTPIDGKVEVSALVQNGSLEVRVKDNGVGISSENQLRLFEEGVQFHAKAHQGGGGSGLGLWISKKIVEMHGGRIGVESEGEGHGCTFFFSIPTQENTNEAPTSLGLRVSGTDSQDTLQDPLHASGGIDLQTRSNESSLSDSMKIRESTKDIVEDRSNGDNVLKASKILIVDDSALNRKMMLNRMKKLECGLAEADDGDTAVDMVAKSLRGEGQTFHVITMDNVVIVLNLILCTCYPKGLGYATHARSGRNSEDTNARL